MKKITLAIAMQLLGLAGLRAQQIKGLVKDEQGNPVNNATVSLLKAADSTVIKLELSKDGAFNFANIQPDSMLIGISYVGHENFYSEKFYYRNQAVTFSPFVLRTLKSSLQTVTVSAKKRIVEIKPDRTVLNVEGTINSTGSDALELLRKSPGVAIDNDDKLSVNGKNGVQVYIDNKPSPLNGQDLSNYLKSIPSSQIEAIEIIHNPGVMYEASGSAGIINIRLKKNRSMGFNGSVNAGISASKHARWDDGFSINYRNKRINAYGTYSGNYGKLESEFELHRVVKDTAFDQKAEIWQNKLNHSFKAGIDYTLNAKSNLGVMVNGNFSSPEILNLNVTPISYYPTGDVDKILASGNFTKQRNTNVNSNINYSYKDTLGRSFTVNADYGYYDNTQDQGQLNSFLDASGKNELYQRNYLIASPTRIDIYSLKADYEKSFAKGRLAFGGKAGYVKTANDFSQFNEVDSDWKFDKDRSNFFGYKENVNAAYVNYSRELKGVAIQGGIRAEQTALEGNLRSFKKAGSDYVEEVSTFSKNYLDFFPSVSITVAPKSKNQFSLAYSRRIDRPVYQNLNPFEYRINEYTYHKGSIDLQPQYTNTVSLTHTYMYKLTTTLSYSHVNDVFGQLVDTAQGLKGYMVNANIATQDIANLSVSYPLQLRNYNLFVNLNSYYSKYKGDFGTNRSLDLDVWAVNIFAQNSYRFSKGWTAEISGFYSSPSIWQGTLKTSDMWSVDMGLQKQIWDGKATIKASVSDVFKSLKWTATSHFAGQDVSAAGRFESRQLKLNFSYRFGNKNVKAARQYKTGLEDENNRAQSGGGLGHQ